MKYLHDIFRWSPQEAPSAAEMLAAGIGMATPVLVGMLAGNTPAGFAAALGALANTAPQGGLGLRRTLLRQVIVLLSIALAAALGVGLAGQSMQADLIRIAVIALAAIISGYSPRLAALALVFMLFLLIISAAPALTGSAGPALFGFAAIGALWTAALGQVFATLLPGRSGSMPQVAAPQPTRAERRARWKRSLTRLAGWSYPLRLVAALVAGAVVSRLWPGHDWHWIGLTAVLVTEQAVEPFPVRTIQRALGTAIGVAVAVLFRIDLPPLAVVLAIAMLAGARPYFRATNYLLYSAVMTPLIVLIIDAGRMPTESLLMDRLVGTFLGAAIVVAANVVFGRLQQALEG